MIYVSVTREVLTRLQFHLGGILKGMKVVTSGEFRLEGQQDLPQITLIDLTVNDQVGKSNGSISMFLRTERVNDWAKTTDDGPLGLIDWMEAVFDALRTRPSDGAPDQLLVVHNRNGDVLLDDAGNEFVLLTDAFTLSAKMAEITDLSFTMQLDLSFALATSGRGTARRIPFPAGTV